MTTRLPVAAEVARPIDEGTPRKWRPASIALVLTLALRIFYSLFAALISPYLRLDPKLIESNYAVSQLISRDSQPLLYAIFGVWQRFDTLWYIKISHHGYDSDAGIVFYPLYPILIRLTSYVTHFDLASALLISTAASFFLCWGALRLFELDTPSGITPSGITPSAITPAAIPSRAILLWMVWPASFAFFAGYPDSLLCALTIWSLYFAQKARWIPAGVLGLLAGFTKALGSLTALPLLWIAWRQRNRTGLVPALLPAAAFVCFQGWLALHHFPSTTQVYRVWWATTTVAPWTTIGEAIVALAHGGNFLLLLNAAAFALVAIAALMSRAPVEYKIYALAALCVFLTKHTEPLLQSTTRYSLVVFAAYPALAARLGRRLSFVAVMLECAVVNLLLFRVFLDWGLVV